MGLQIGIAVVAPFLLVALFTRVTFNLYVSGFLAAAVLYALFQSYLETTPLLITIGIFSIAGGILYSYVMLRRLSKRK